MMFSALFLVFFIACEDDDHDDHDHDHDDVTALQTPSEYVFNSRFSEGESSVSYSGQVVRNLLVNDIKTQCGTDAGSGNPATLLSMMANDNADQAILAADGLTTVQTKYHDISTSHLNDRLDAVSDYTIPGYEANAGTLLNGWLNELAASGKTLSLIHI